MNVTFMRVGSVTQWLRGWIDHRSGRACGMLNKRGLFQWVCYHKNFRCREFVVVTVVSTVIVTVVVC